MIAKYFFQVVIILPFLEICVASGSNGEPLVPPYTCTTTTRICQNGEGSLNNRNMQSTGHHSRIGKAGPRGPMGPKGEKGEPSRSNVEESDFEELKRRMSDLELKYEALETKTALLEDIVKYPADCQEYHLIQKQRGELPSQDLVKVFPYKNVGNLTFYMVNCSSVWTVIQRRIDGTVDFYRNWESYVEGFGSSGGEFWIGLETLHKLTSSGNYTLRIDLEDWEMEKRYAEYSTFRVGDAESKYTLAIGGYSGDAGDTLDYHNGMKFTTHDADNDKWGSNCAEIYSGAWWHQSCYKSSLNGKYLSSSSAPDNRGIAWNSFHPSTYSLKHVEMKIRLN